MSTIYIPTPVSQEPETEGQYFVSNGSDWFRANWNKQYGFHAELADCSGITEWLRPVDRKEYEKQTVDKDNIIDAFVNGMYLGNEIAHSKDRIKLDVNSLGYAIDKAEHYYKDSISQTQNNKK